MYSLFKTNNYTNMTPTNNRANQIKLNILAAHQAVGAADPIEISIKYDQLTSKWKYACTYDRDVDINNREFELVRQVLHKQEFL
ncbi:hypothetical protein GKIL_3666 [Gloeobacter kilaueensis JS1]|uniref:Uncharacterized protein n=1 Tax=Gloeobacter kilaueensis (strain ATCC BAA-2537 / CCAP 1431/1 / ULC 316 / JS1) TaxID=1183438 RepID=U5QLQ7_GLOK1|nr:hypothetical protein GKIL_3666 [Gloeobacter kilaueensis JS1]